jgi:hypothetical protein
MPALHIRDIPEEVIEALKRRAAENDRSLQKELRHILISLVRDSPPLEPLPPLQLILSNARPDTDWSRSEIYEDDGR